MNAIISFKTMNKLLLEIIYYFLCFDEILLKLVVKV